MQRYLIIGAGAAGMAAAESIRSRDAQSEIVLACEEPESYYSRPGLAYLLTGELGEKLLYPFHEKDYQRLKIRRFNARAMYIDGPGQMVSFQDGQSLSYDRLLVATGSQAALPKIPGIDLEGVVKLDNIADARKIMQLARKAKNAIVVGGGITALEIVEGLAARGQKPAYFLRGERYWSNVLDETESQIIEQRLHEEGVQIQTHTELQEVLGKNGRVCAVATQDGRQISCDLLAVAIGVLPRTELAQNSGLRVEKGIWVNELLQTSQVEIYSAGDVAETFDPLTGKTQLNTLWPLARDQGRIAGINMVNSRNPSNTLAPYRKSVPFNVTRLGGLTTTIIGSVGTGRDQDLIGIARGDSETWRQLPDAIAAQANFKVNRLRIMVGENRLIGAVVMGDQSLSRPLQHLINRQVDITPIRKVVLQPEAQVADIIAAFWSEQRER